MNHQPTDRSRETVVLIHGLGGNRSVMYPLAQRLAAMGYRTLNWGYWSYLGRIEKHATRLARRIEMIAEEGDTETIHFAAHSLGSLLVRAMLNEAHLEKAGRAVFLAPPSRGSPVATRVRPYVRWIVPVVDQLSDRDDSYVNGLPRTVDGIEVGVLTAARDILVPLELTRLDGVADEHMLDCRHATIVWQPETAGLVDRFLREGTFGSMDRTAVSE